MKISSIIWLKSFGGNVGRVYTSRIYAIEFSDDIGYEVNADLLSKKRSAGYIDRAPLPDFIDHENVVQYLTKHKNPTGTITDALGNSFEILGVTKHINPTAIFDDGIGHSSQVITLNKRLGGYYLVKTLPADQMDAGSIISALEKARRVKNSKPVNVDVDIVSTATDIYKVRQVILGNASDAADFGNIVQSIKKISKYIYASSLDLVDCVNSIESIDRHKNPTSENLEHIAASSLVLDLSKKSGAGYLFSGVADKTDSASIVESVSKIHPFIYGAMQEGADVSSYAHQLSKTRKIFSAELAESTGISSYVRQLSKARKIFSAELDEGISTEHSVTSIDKKSYVRDVNLYTESVYSNEVYSIVKERSTVGPSGVIYSGYSPPTGTFPTHDTYRLGNHIIPVFKRDYVVPHNDINFTLYEKVFKNRGIKSGYTSPEGTKIDLSLFVDDE